MPTGGGKTSQKNNLKKFKKSIDKLKNIWYNTIEDKETNKTITNKLIKGVEKKIKK